MIYFALFVLIVFAIGVVTNRLNTKTPCNHNWEKQPDGIKCCKCGRKIPAAYVTVKDDPFSEAA